MNRGVLVALVVVAQSAASQPLACPRGDRPAYAHNDYLNARPLLDALETGLRGVEADVFLVNGILRVGHDRDQARTGARFDSLYLAPLRDIVERCGAVTADGQPFLLTVEIKEASDSTYAALLDALHPYRSLLVSRPRPAVNVVLVGWHPRSAPARRGPDSLLGIQHRITSTRPAGPLDARVRLLSLDYGKTMGRWWVRSGGRRRWMAALREAKRASPARLLRAHNVPTDARLHDELRAAGVDLIGLPAGKHVTRPDADLGAGRPDRRVQR